MIWCTLLLRYYKLKLYYNKEKNKRNKKKKQTKQQKKQKNKKKTKHDQLRPSSTSSRY